MHHWLHEKIQEKDTREKEKDISTNAREEH
jgi:hypothetical protein